MIYRVERIGANYVSNGFRGGVCCQTDAERCYQYGGPIMRDVILRYLPEFGIWDFQKRQVFAPLGRKV